MTIKASLRALWSAAGLRCACWRQSDTYTFAKLRAPILSFTNRPEIWCPLLLWQKAQKSIQNWTWSRTFWGKCQSLNKLLLKLAQNGTSLVFLSLRIGTCHVKRVFEKYESISNITRKREKKKSNQHQFGQQTRNLGGLVCHKRTLEKCQGKWTASQNIALKQSSDLCVRELRFCPMRWVTCRSSVLLQLNLLRIQKK